jgi:hypothetical protein
MAMLSRSFRVSTPYVQWIVAENHGRNPDHPNDRRYPMPSLDWIYPDPDEDRDVELAIYPPTISGTPDDELHWAITWKVGEFPNENPTPDGSPPPPLHIYRVVQLVADPGRPYYTYWGPITHAVSPRTITLHQIHIATLSLRDRHLLEECALEAPVYLPNGKFNCQNWAWDVLNRAVGKGIFPQGSISAVPDRRVSI